MFKQSDNRNNCRGQVWSLDLMVGLFIFLFAMLFFFKYAINSMETDKENNDLVLLNAKLVSSYLVSAGYPIDWSPSNVILIGLTDGETRLIESKVSAFNSIASSDYTASKRYLSTMRDYSVHFEDRYGSIINISGVSYIGKDHLPDNPENIIKVERFVMYNSSIIKLVVYSW